MRNISHTNIAGWAAAIFIAVLPFVTTRQLFFGSVNAKYFFIVGFISLFVLYFSYLVISRKHSIKFDRRWLVLTLIVSLAVYYLSSFMGIYPERSFWSDMVRSSGLFFLTYIAVFAFCAGEIFSARDWTIVRRAIAISAGLFALLSFLSPDGFAIGGRFLMFNFDISGLTLGNSTFAGAYLLIGFVITLIELSRVGLRSQLGVFFGVLAVAQFLSPLLINIKALINGSLFTSVFSNPTLLLGNARASGAVAIFIIVYLGGWIMFKKFLPTNFKSKVIHIWSALWIIGLFVAVSMLFISGSVVQEKYIESSTAARVIVWESGIQAFKERPILGWGPENFRFAFEHHLDNRLHMAENIGEAWFDRAHNVIIDTIVSVGIVGTIATVMLIIVFISTVVRAQRRGIIADLEAYLLGIMPIAHIVQLQTSFDTVATYTLSGIVLGYVLSLEKKVAVYDAGTSRLSDSPGLQVINQKILPAVLILMVLIGTVFLLFGEYGRQKALYRVFIATDSDKQLLLIPKVLSRQSDFESLRFSAASFLKGFFVRAAGATADDQKKIVADGIKQMSVYEKYYEEYLKSAPEDYRARMNYAYMLIIETAFGVDRMDTAKAVIKDSYRLSPQSPIVYTLDAVAELYSGRIKESKEKINEAIALNPDIAFTKNVRDYIEKQERQFPNISVIKLDNL